LRGRQARLKKQYFQDKEDIVVLAFSGGGTRAAAFSYGVLEALRRTEVIGPKGNRERLLDSVPCRHRSLTIGELAYAPPSLLVMHFGAHYGAWLAEAAQGHDQRPVETENEVKSISGKLHLSATCTPGMTAPYYRASSPPCASRWRGTSRAKAMPAGRSGSSCDSTISAR